MIGRVSVVGLGKLGLCLAACFAHKGIRTIGVDVLPGVVNAINAGTSPLVEPSMDELIRKLGGNMLRATLDHAEALEQTDITFILTATPSNPDGSFSNHHIEAALASLARTFRVSEKNHHTFVISSTVVPESIAHSFIPLIERESGRKLHDDFDVCYDPDFVALGNVVHDFLNPDLVIIGESRPGAGDPVEAVHRKICESTPHIARMPLVSAEIAKVSLNAYITMKISFANTIANLCERIAGADTDAVTEAIGRDRRISPYYFRGGLSFGGTCFPRDTRAFSSIATRYGLEPLLMNAVERVNILQDHLLTTIVLSEIDRTPCPVVGILGLSFKPKTPVIIESPAVKLIRTLLENSVKIIVYDPLAKDAVRSLFGNRISYAASVRACLAASSVCVIANPDELYRDAVHSFQPSAPLTVVDCWRNLNGNALSTLYRHRKLGQAD